MPRVPRPPGASHVRNSPDLNPPVRVELLTPATPRVFPPRNTVKLRGGKADGGQDEGVVDSAGSQAAESPGAKARAVPPRRGRGAGGARREGRMGTPLLRLSRCPTGNRVPPAGVTHLTRSSRKITLLQQPTKTRPTAQSERMPVSGKGGSAQRKRLPILLPQGAE